MSLIELVDNSRTDKNTTHSYLDLYEKLLFSKKETPKNLKEFIKSYDLRNIKGRYDDIVFTIDKSKI